MEDEKQQNNWGNENTGKQQRMMDYPDDYSYDSNYKMCSKHKQKVEFVCTSEECHPDKFLCPKCNARHFYHKNYILEVDDYLLKMAEKERELCQQRKDMVEEKTNRLKKMVNRISKSIDRYESRELEEVEQLFDDITLRCNQDQQKFLNDFCNPVYDTTKLLKVTPYKNELHFQKIQDAAQNLIYSIEKKEYNLQNLIGFLVRQDNLFEIVNKHEARNNSAAQNIRQPQNAPVFEEERMNANNNNIQPHQQNLNNQVQNHEIPIMMPQQDINNLFDNLPQIHQNQHSNQQPQNLQNLVGNVNNNAQGGQVGNNINDILAINQGFEEQVNNQQEIINNVPNFLLNAFTPHQMMMMLNAHGIHQVDNEDDWEDFSEDDEDEDGVEEEWFTETSMSSDLENGRKITSMERLSNEVIVFSNINSVYFYNFVTRQVLYSQKFSGNVFIKKVVTLGEKKIAVLLQREFIDNLIQDIITFQLLFEVFILKIENKKLKKQRVFAEKRGYEIRDIMQVKNSSLLAIVQEEIGIVILNTVNCKIISSFECDIGGAIPFEGIYSCTMLSNIKVADQTYKQLMAVNLIDGSYGLWDFASNSYIMKKRFSNNIGLNYKFSRGIRISEKEDKEKIDKKSKQSMQSDLMEDVSQSDVEEFVDMQQYLIVIQGERGETYLQRDYDGSLEVKMSHKLLDCFDLFYNGCAIPFYYNNSIFFYDFKQQKRLKTISLNTKYNQSAYLYENQKQLMEQTVTASQHNRNVSNFFGNQSSVLSSINRDSSQVINRNNRNTVNQNIQQPMRQNQHFSAMETNQSRNNQQQTSSNPFNIDESEASQRNQYRQGRNSQQQMPIQQSNNYKYLNEQEIEEEEIKSQRSINSKQKKYSMSSSSVSSKQKQSKNRSARQQIEQQEPQINESVVSQLIDDPSLIEYLQGQTGNGRNIESIPVFTSTDNPNHRNLSQQLNILNNTNDQTQNFHSNRQDQQRKQQDRLTRIQFGNQFKERSFLKDNTSIMPEQNDLLQLNNYKLYDICPIGIINHHKYIVIVFPNGVIQYVQ